MGARHEWLLDSSSEFVGGASLDSVHLRRIDWALPVVQIDDQFVGAHESLDGFRDAGVADFADFQ